MTNSDRDDERSNKLNPSDESPTTRQRILKAAQEEFLRLGFQGSSLRSIVKAAGVTTGALYGYYPDKEALFDALVREPAETLYGIYLRGHDDFAAMEPDKQISEMQETSSETVWVCFDYVYAHFEAFKLILCHSEGTAYADYLHRLAEVEIQSSHTFFSLMNKLGRPVSPIPDDLSHMLASAYLTGFFETVIHNMPRQAAREYIEKLTGFYAAGWKSLLGIT